MEKSAKQKSSVGSLFAGEIGSKSHDIQIRGTGEIFLGTNMVDYNNSMPVYDVNLLDLLKIKMEIYGNF